MATTSFELDSDGDYPDLSITELGATYDPVSGDNLPQITTVYGPRTGSQQLHFGYSGGNAKIVIYPPQDGNYYAISFWMKYISSVPPAFFEVEVDGLEYIVTPTATHQLVSYPIGPNSSIMLHGEDIVIDDMELVADIPEFKSVWANGSNIILGLGQCGRM